MNVVQHGPSDIVGICTSDTKQCNRRTLKKSELALYRIDHKKLATKVAEAIGFTEQHEKITGHTALWKFGVLNPQAEHSFPVYCFLGQTSSQLDKIINQLYMGEQMFLLIATTSSLISTASSDASSRHKSKIIGLDDVLAVDGTDSHGERQFSNYRFQLAGNSVAKIGQAGIRVSIPDTSWRNMGTVCVRIYRNRNVVGFVRADSRTAGT